MTIANINHVKQILGDKKAKKKFGQNFLIDANIVDKIAKGACENDLPVIEIGPGLGALTEMLKKYASKVYAYEIDEDMYDILKEEFADTIDLTLGDFLDLDLDSVPYKDEEICVCSNLPYYVTTPILFKLFESDLKIKKITVMVQKEVAERFKAEINSEDYNALSIIVQYLYDVKQEMNISKKVFYPSPNVDSAVISFSPKTEKRNPEFEKKFFDFVKKCFMKRRKTLNNNLKEFLSNEQIVVLFEKTGLKPTVRAQELSLNDYLRMYKSLYEN